MRTLQKQPSRYALLACILSVGPVGLSQAQPWHSSGAPLQFAMMDMMPMGGGGMQQPGSGGAAMPGMPQAPGTPGSVSPPGPAMGGMTDDNRMRMGGGMPGPAQAPMPQQQAQMPMGQSSMAGCPMMAAMMQNMMRMGAGGMAAMPGSSGPAGAMTTPPTMMPGGMPTGSSAARLEGRIAFLRTELGITAAQAGAWDTFANALRQGREHLDAARAALESSASAAEPMARLEAFESHLRQRTEAIHMTRMAFNTLYGQLDDAQKRAAVSTMLPFIGAF